MEFSKNGIPLNTLKLTLFLFLLVLILAIPKVYLSSQIYYQSKEVNDLEQDVAVLKSQNDMLMSNIEQLKYKRDITDMIIAY